MDGPYPPSIGIRRTGKTHRYIVQENGPTVRRVVAAEDLDQRRLPSSVCARQSADLSFIEVARNILECTRSTEGDPEMPRRDERRRVHGCPWEARPALPASNGPCHPGPRESRRSPIDTIDCLLPSMIPCPLSVPTPIAGTTEPSLTWFPHPAKQESIAVQDQVPIILLPGPESTEPAPVLHPGISGTSARGRSCLSHPFS